MKKVLFIQPHKTFIGEYRDDFVRPVPSTAAMAILGQLKNYETYFLDAMADNVDNSFAYNGHINMVGISKEEIQDRISEIMPDVILLTSTFAAEYFAVNWLAEAIKEKFRIPIIVGGQQASIRPEWHLETGNIDSIVKGEGELIIRKAIEDSVEGKLQRIYVQERLSDLDQPFEMNKIMLKAGGKTRYPLSSTLRNPSLYLPEGENIENPTGVLYFSRGCPYGCKYCSAVDRNGRNIRHASLERMVDHIKESLSLGISTFTNGSDAFGIHPLDIRLFEHLGNLRQKGENINLVNTNGFFVRYFFENGELSEDKVKLLKDAGVGVVSLTIDSFNEKYNNNKFKDIDNRNLIGLVEFLRHEKIKTDVYMIVDFPDQTIEEMKKDIRLARGLGADTVTVRALELFPGAQYYEEAIAQCRFTERQYKEEILKGYSFYKVRSELLNLSRVPLNEIKAIVEERGQ